MSLDVVGNYRPPRRAVFIQFGRTESLVTTAAAILRFDTRRVPVADWIWVVRLPNDSHGVSMSVQFVGATHNDAVETLLARLRSAQETNSAHFVMLRGPSGIGKSRIIKEFYERLRLETADSYWPPMADWGHVDSADPLQGRKLLAPPTDGFVWGSDALPTFTWWAFECHKNESGDVLDVVAQAGPSIRAHAIPAGLAVRRSKGGLRSTFDEGLGRVRKALGDSKGDLVLEALDKLGVAVPGLPWIVEGAALGRSAWQERREERQALHSDVDQGAVARQSRDADVRRYADAIVATTAPDLPCIFVVEDMHRLGPELLLLLTQVAKAAAGPVLIIGTVWPECRNEGGLLGLEGDLADADVGFSEVGIGPLEGEHLRAWVCDLAPETDSAIVQRLVAQYSNPLAMKLFLGLRSTRRAIRDGALDLTLDDIDNLPEDLQEVYQRRWSELPDDVKQALALAAGVLPQQQLDVIGQVVGEAAGAVGVEEDEIDELTQALRRDAADLEWMTLTSPDRQAFKEEILRDIALLNIGTYVHQSKLSRLAQAAEEILERRLVECSQANEVSLVAEEEEAEVLSRWLLNFTAPTEALSTGRAVAVLTLAGLMAEADRPRAALNLIARYQPWRNAFDVDDKRYWAARNQEAWWCGLDARFEDAVAQFERIATECADRFGALDAQTVYARRMRSHYLQEAGRLAEAIEATDELLSDLTASPAGHEAAITTLRQNRVGYLGETGQHATAAERWEELIEEARLRGDEQEVRRMKRNQVSNFRESGQTDRAFRMLENLHAAYVADGDLDSVESLRTQMDLAMMCAEKAEQRASAVELAGKAVEAGADRWGSTSDLVLGLRGNRAKILIDTASKPGDYAEPLTLLRQLVEDYQRYGSQVPDGVGWAMSLAARCALGAEDLPEAVELGKAAHELRVNDLGRGDLRTHKAANVLALSLSRSGEYAAVVALTDDYLEAFAADTAHGVSTLQLRAQRANALVRIGQRSEAHAEATALLSLMETNSPSDVPYLQGVLGRSRPHRQSPRTE
ncbi:hypothetical protein [Nocardioides sp. zg-DK7169]|uniref:hypothetical protein n=1 Tax=Nocardioides sp. zg-DK7169 TaxID=2736600 RepID=UPI0015558FFF|nr:hypothetical protein [Nocardioides sp. zg-DK7169]NPC97851.1 hypothetical protein [Nocardioides sp. zg-DK7169]